MEAYDTHTPTYDASKITYGLLLPPPVRGDHMYVNIDDSIRHMTKGLGIYVLAQRLNMECCLSSDEAGFTKKGRGHTTMGLKFTELSAIDPAAGERLLVSTDENGKEYYRNTQSLKYITICVRRAM